jgi:ABC-type dipeptide/oligopeptide/nickel transport system permease component
LFILRRLAQAVAAIILTTFLVYVGMIQLGDPFNTLGEKTLPPETQAALRAKFGWDKPFLIRYLIYLKNLASGELGIDYQKRAPVATLLAHTAPNTLRLAVLAMGLVVLISITAGLLSAQLRTPFVDVLFAVTTTLMFCIPLFVVAAFLRVHLAGFSLFGVELFPPPVPRYMQDVPWFKQVLLPAITMAIGESALITRLMRGSMLEIMDSDYVRTARAKGLSRFTIMRKHVLRNALIPVVQYCGITIGVLMGGAVIVESIFSYDGVGNLFVGALHTNNNPIIVAVAVYSLITFVTLSAIVDMFTAYLDPRIRLH